MRSWTIPSFIHPSDSFDRPSRPTPANGAPLSVRIRSGTPYKAGVLSGVETSVHAGENGEAACRWKGEVAFVAETVDVLLIRGEDFVENLAHDDAP
jgi:hypothetical protein